MNMRERIKHARLFQYVAMTSIVIAGLSGCGGDSSKQPTASELADQRASTLVAQMTEDEKIQLIGSAYAMADVPGGGGGFIRGIPRLGIPDINMVDSTTGSGSSSQLSTTFPSTLALAASWDAKLTYDYGAVVAKQLRAQGFGMGLGGGVNMVRDPRGGRIFEYMGEDPFLAGKLIAQRTVGTQDQHVIATVKHFAGNEQEVGRGGGNTQIDERTLRQIYLLPFEIAVQESNPGNIMCSYNKVNGLQACESGHLLNDILKKEWGFKGQVQSDWGATHSTANAINAGLDEEEDVGAISYFTPTLMHAALSQGLVTQSRLDDMVKRKLRTMIVVGLMDNPPPAVGGSIDQVAGTKFAQLVEEESIVLLKNDNKQLPLKAQNLKNIAVIGAHADAAVLSGGGSGATRMPMFGAFAGCGGLSLEGGNGCQWWSNPWKKVPTPILAAIQQAAPNATVSYGGNSDEAAPFREYTQAEIDQAVALAKQSDVAIVVVAQPAGEDFGDLKTLSLVNPSNQDDLVTQVAAANPNTIVVIQSGNPILMPWKDKVSAIVAAWNPGEGGGPAIANVLFGVVNPSGKLPVTFPKNETDTPTGGGSFVKDPVYTEGLNVGYRWYDAKNVAPMFEFGFGLSYTTFAYSDLVVNTNAKNEMTVSFTIKNSGAVEGKEVPQVYLSFPASANEPPKRLVAWSKVNLKPGQTQKVIVTVPQKMQSIWNVNNNAWQFIPGSKVSVGASSRDIRLLQ